MAAAGSSVPRVGGVVADLKIMEAVKGRGPEPAVNDWKAVAKQQRLGGSSAFFLLQLIFPSK
jgi:hypothetical protein